VSNSLSDEQTDNDDEADLIKVTKDFFEKNGMAYTGFWKKPPNAAHGVRECSLSDLQNKAHLYGLLRGLSKSRKRTVVMNSDTLTVTLRTKEASHENIFAF
jgi:hypothetical protein